MTDTTDTSPEAVERLAARLYCDGDPGPVHPLFFDAAATLRALAAERDALIEARDMMGRLWEQEKARAEVAEAALEEAGNRETNRPIFRRNVNLRREAERRAEALQEDRP